jgi:hypothetical protein
MTETDIEEASAGQAVTTGRGMLTEEEIDQPPLQHLALRLK